VARVNYQRDKRQKDLARQRKQEEKRQRKLQKDLDPNAPVDPEEGSVGDEEPSDEATPDEAASDGVATVM